MPNPSIGPITVDLPSPPVIAGNVAGSSTHATSELRDKGKGKAVVADLEPEVEGSRKRKSPMMSGHSSSPPKQLANVKPKVFVESEDEEDSIVQWSAGAQPAPASTIVVGMPIPFIHPTPQRSNYLVLLHAPKVMATSSSRPELIETPRQCPALRLRNLQSLIQVIFSFPAWRIGPAPLGWTGGPVFVMHPLHHQEDQMCPSINWIPTQTHSREVYHHQTHSRTPSRAPSNAPAAWQSKAQTRSQSCGPSGTPAVPAVTTPKAQSRGRSKTITATKTPAPAPAHESPQSIPSSSSAVPCLALDVPMLDLHSMAIAIRDGAAQIALLEARVAEQDGKIDTLQHLHEGLQCKVIDQCNEHIGAGLKTPSFDTRFMSTGVVSLHWHPSFPLPDSPVNATFFLDQSVPLSISPLPSALALLIELDMAGMEPLPLKVQDASAIEGLIFERSQIQPEGPQTSGEIMDLDDPGNLVPEYDSDDMDVEVKVEPSGDEVEMAT
ncbi:hypothetical protein BDR07DRAFT_1481395 [Suillus spraguei]|nr:hypothetical protein BDR07DRAFT_1481395 [Suillus spraguei]